jgi:hypothetical protein
MIVKTSSRTRTFTSVDAVPVSTKAPAPDHKTIRVAAMPAFGPEPRLTGPKGPETPAKTGLDYAPAGSVEQSIVPGNQHFSTPVSTRLKIVVSPVQVRVSPLELSLVIEHFLFDELPV